MEEKRTGEFVARLRTDLEEWEMAAGRDIPPLPESLQAFAQWMIDKKDVGLADIAIYCGQGDEVTSELVDACVEKGFVRRIEVDGESRYQCCLASRQRGPSPRQAWQQLAHLGISQPIVADFFSGLEPSGFEELEADLEWLRLQGGETLFHQGDPGDSLYIVLHGRLCVVVNNQDGSERVIGEVGRGESVGEMAVLTGEDRSATVRAIRDTELVKLSKAKFEGLVEKHPQMLMRITQLMIMRLRQSIQAREFNTLSTIALIPASRDVALSEFANRLAQAMTRHASTLHLSSGRLRGFFGDGSSKLLEDESSGGRLTEWLDEQETAHRYVIYESDAELSSWARRCLRQADRILIIANAESELPPGEIEAEIMRPGRHNRMARRELVLLRNGDLSFQTGRWLAAGRAERHHHVRMSFQPDFDRLARFLTGRAVGLVLGGGGARGFAHIGVLRALELAGVPIDLVGGTSMGACIAATCAMGWDYKTILEKAKIALNNPRALWDLTVPIVSTFMGRKIVRVLTSLFGDTQIEDLPIKYVAVSSNLTRAEVRVHRQGPLWRAVRASAAVPIITSPVLSDGDLLVDGAFLNNLPIDIMRPLCEGGPLIVVDVSSQIDLMSCSPFGDYLSGWEVLRSKINPFSQKLNVPNMITILFRSMELQSVQRQQEIKEKADYYLRPPVETFGILDFKSFGRIAEIGYQYAEKKIEEWKGSLF